MSRIFRIATEQAIREMIEEEGESGRFGLLLTDENVGAIATKVVDLFEMTLELRSKTSEIFSPQASAKNKEAEFQEPQAFPRTKSGAEVYFAGEQKKNNRGELPMAPHMDFKLPRKRFEMSLEEKERASRRPR
jgi:hypothetical protein